MANPLGTLLNSLTDSQNPVVQVLNQEVRAVEGVVEGVGHALNLDGTVAGLTNAGGTIGLGEIGGANLITDTARAPGDIINGANPVTVVSEIVTDAGESASAAGGILQGLGSDLASAPILSAIGGGAAGAVNTVTGVLFGGIGGGGESDEPIVSASAGDSGDPHIVNAGVLHERNDSAPVGVAAGSGENVANVNAAPRENGGSHPISGSAGAGDDSATFHASTYDDGLQFPDLAGAGTDLLAGLTPSVFRSVNVGEDVQGSAPTLDGPTFFGVHTDGSTQVNAQDNLDPVSGTHHDAII